MVKEHSKTNKRGRKRIAERWLIVALVVIARIERGDSVEKIRRETSMV